MKSLRLRFSSPSAAMVFGLWVVVGTQLPACDDGGRRERGDAGSGTGDAGVRDAAVVMLPATEEAFCHMKAEAECAGLAARCGSAIEVCQQARLAACMNLAAGQRMGLRLFKPQNTVACLEDIARAYEDSVVSPADWKEMQEACKRVWEGNGSPVTMSSCASAHDCFREFICDKGKCASPIVKGPFALCSAPGEICGPDQVCRVAGSVGQCDLRSSDGEACSKDRPCEQQLHCTAAGVCEQRLGFGAACHEDGQCRDDLCEPFQARCLVSVIFSAGNPACVGFLQGKDSVPTMPPDAGTPMSKDAGSMDGAGDSPAADAGRDAAHD